MKTERVLVACSLWLHLGFIGAMAVAAGLIMLFDAEVNWLLALLLAFGGGALAAGSWRRARTVLERAEPEPAAADAAANRSRARPGEADSARWLFFPGSD